MSLEGEGRAVTNLGGAPCIMNGAGDENPALAIDDYCSSIVGHVHRR